MHVPLLALDYLRRKSKDSFLYAPELSYRERGAHEPLCEEDLNCVVDGLMTIGEAKTNDRLGKNDKEDWAVISAYLDLGKKLAVQQVVFATSGEQWQAGTIEKLTKAFANGPRWVALTRADLYP